MRKLPFCALLISGMLFFVSCNNDENEPIANVNNAIPQAILDVFQSQYGNTRAEWSVRNGYAIAEFWGENGETTAWYSLNNGSWGMTETEIPFTALPDAICTAISQSAYANWVPDEWVDVLDRNGAERLYVVELENGGVEVDLYYTESGILVNEQVDSDGKENDYSGYFPQTPATDIYAWIEQHYPGARVVDVDIERNGTEIEFIYDGLKYEVWFDTSSAWIQTKIEYGRRNIPDIVVNFVRTNYPDYHIDDVERYETKKEIYYCIELERGDRERKIYLNEQGEEISRPSNDGVPSGGGDIQVGSGIEAILNTLYPGFVIVEKDYDDGHIEIDIIHNHQEKEVVFNFKEEWLYTTYDIHSNQLPDAVKTALDTRFGANSYWDEDAECIETPSGTYYEVEVWDEIDVYISADGEILRIED